MRKEEEGSGYRHARLQILLLDELDALLRDDVSDPALVEVRIVAVVLSVDYRHARVHFALRASPDALPRGRQATDHALCRVTPFLRARLAEALDMKRVPDLRFVFDGLLPLDDIAAQRDP